MGLQTVQTRIENPCHGIASGFDGAMLARGGGFVFDVQVLFVEFILLGGERILLDGLRRRLRGSHVQEQRSCATDHGDDAGGADCIERPLIWFACERDIRGSWRDGGDGGRGLILLLLQRVVICVVEFLFADGRGSARSESRCWPALCPSTMRASSLVSLSASAA